MLNFNSDPAEAAREMEGVIFYLAAFGYIDGDFDRSERDYIDEFILALAESAEPDNTTSAGRARRAALVDRLDRRFQRIDAELQAMWDEPTADGERAPEFVRSRTKVRCFEILEDFAPQDRAVLIEAVDQLLMADGVAHPEEVKFRDELAALVHAKAKKRDAPLTLQLAVGAHRWNRVAIHPQVERSRTDADHPSLEPLERNYSQDPEVFRRQLNQDMKRIRQVTQLLEIQRKSHRGALKGFQTVQELGGMGSFIDDHVHIVAPTRPVGYELIVVGDLHGCYSCLKAALMQSDFLAKVERFKREPLVYPEPMMVLLGDYIDRGYYSFEGVMRGVLALMLAAPGHVIALRGNHEYFHEKDGVIIGGVRPAEALDGLKPYVENEVLKAYKELFETLPNMMIFDDVMFVHGGIPRDATLRDRYRDLSSLNDPNIRFEMMWSDPSTADVVPEELQAGSARFSFGREQARAFMHRIGVRTIIRGHEKVKEGFTVAFDEPDLRVMTLFSAGGADNFDLPERSSYRSVIPTALTIRYRDGRTDIEPWVIDYASYNDPAVNGFFDYEYEE